MKPFSVSLLLLLTPALTLAMTAEERGLEIATEIEARDTGFHDFKATMSMLLRNKHGEESLRDMRNQTLEVENDGDKTLVVFDEPRDVKGTALLSFSHKVGDDDQWLYLPALKRVKRIASRNKSGPFMGSEFAYEDISSQEVEKYTYKFIEESEYEGTPCFLIERYPVDPNSGYTRQQVWVDQERYIALKIDYYDRKNAPLKTLVFRGYRQYLDQYWRADEMFMENHQTGKSTLLTWKEYNFRTGLTDGDFNKNSLKRAR
ncbi:MAG: outer membrane lipoprotein-sorting protein [gamma proteobacterium symbiont of Ctena orbiculata]|uniref:Outer membrane lipoprotein-sorting protein n=1 Tax=Candidatus Thiodiazotropha taylori TaxID=2792791 RepID=A0A944QWM7_9GAMM|nr:outer membrane lipoprotein-sorting protein [Candidatus Thiodiazotropha taylori]PUB85294.1 MAG: outer membrane lipoprotein-sorting protein [gamma proteobacterium symbiont of Ctena orbiculata]MBT2990436.1 outer membrane lipoprotein-sorting protein [Candidatus Thiodiazotropha taylori]MBT2998463.1 outer membrane lipoprotein-sorting protein [Candidatus Thiodiazotropha taylori]MBT3002637.1 outer membrane lipoprotein-sorting protein [Candidatus Thiodiazotropha taylori]